MKGANIYLTFDGNAREAMRFYAKSFNADVNVFTFGESPMPCPEGAKDKVMHASFTKNGMTIMASDTVPGMPFIQGNNFCISVSVETIEETDKLFKALSENGKVTMPLKETFWAKYFGMLTDQYGINWMFNLEKPH